jgi:hypothetical protein
VMWTYGARRLNIRFFREAEEISTIIPNQHNGVVSSHSLHHTN